MIVLVGLVMSCEEQVEEQKLDFAHQNVKASNEDEPRQEWRTSKTEHDANSKGERM